MAGQDRPLVDVQPRGDAHVLDRCLMGDLPPVLVRRSGVLADADCITVAPGKAAAAVDERLAAIDAAARRKQAVEELCGLYVAMTRAKIGLEMVCGALVGVTDVGPDAELWRPGKLPPADTGRPPRLPVPDPLRPAVEPAGPASRVRPAVAPSSLEGDGWARLGAAPVIAGDGLDGRGVGSVLHRWFEQVEWLDDLTPDDDALRRAAADLSVPNDRLPGLLRQFRLACGRPSVADLLTRGGRPGLRVWRERPFAVRIALEPGGQPVPVRGFPRPTSGGHRGRNGRAGRLQGRHGRRLGDGRSARKALRPPGAGLSGSCRPAVAATHRAGVGQTSVRRLWPGCHKRLTVGSYWTSRPTCSREFRVAEVPYRRLQRAVHRFQMHYDVRQLATEDRMLRRLIGDHVEIGLGRRTSREEDAALNWAIDLMAQQAMVAFVEHQNGQLREAAAAELKYLSFLSHDLNGNLGNITRWLQILRRSLKDSPQFAHELPALNTAQQAILDTMGGMGRLLQAERLRHQGFERKAVPVNLNILSADVAGQFVQQADQKGVQVEVDVPADATVISDGEIIRPVVQNLLGNAIKYSSRGTVRVRAEQVESLWSLSVSDEGPGIALDKVAHIFEAFRRGDMHGQSGVGLGLAIASRSAKLLNAQLTVESKLGEGSAFRLTFLQDAKGG